MSLQNNIYVILGMHKSGTTLIARLLSGSGIDMGSFDKAIDYDSGNHIERLETKNINKKILNCGNEISIKILKKIELDEISQKQIQHGKSVVDNLSQKYPDWGFKDPRTCLTYDYWKRVLPRHKLICIYRHPSEVVMHYGRWDKIKGIPSAISSAVKSLECWEVYNNELLKIVSQHERFDFIVFRYDYLMTCNSEIHRLEEFLEKKVYDCRDVKKYRSKNTVGILFLIAWLYYLIKYQKNPLRLFSRLEKMRICSI